MNYRAISVLTLLAFSNSAWSTDTVPAGTLEEVVVTASRIERPDFSYSNPVLSITGEDIRQSGVKDMTRFLK